jgi:hypothetical protein
MWLELMSTAIFSISTTRIQPLSFSPLQQKKKEKEKINFGIKIDCWKLKRTYIL